MSQEWLNALMISEIVTSILLIASILMQNRAEGLGRMFGGGGEVFRTRRGVENFLYYFTMILATILAILSFVIVKFSK